jgi:putative YphP/YqiW family bacilliredoxin
MCPREKHTRKKGIMSMELYCNIIDQIVQMGANKITLTNFGEPFIDPTLEEKILIAKQNGLKTYVVSNASLFSVQSKFDESLTKIESAIKNDGTTLVVINSVCGCSAGACRPGVLMAVANASVKPDRITTSFAGFDLEAVNKVREYHLPYPPSSPAIALFKNGELVHMLERHHIEGRPAELIAENLQDAFNEYC